MITYNIIDGKSILHVRPRDDMDPGLWILVGLREATRDYGNLSADLHRKGWNDTLLAYVTAFGDRPVRRDRDALDYALDTVDVAQKHAAWPATWTNFGHTWSRAIHASVLLVGNHEHLVPALRHRFRDVPIAHQR